MKMITKALDMAHRFGGENAPHHMQYCIDQMVRVLTNSPVGMDESEEHKQFKANFLKEVGDEWDAGIAP